MAYASKVAALAALTRADNLQIEESLVYGVISGLCDNNEDIPRDNILRVQGPSGNLRAFDGNRSFLWQDGWYPGAGFARQLPSRQNFCSL